MPEHKMVTIDGVRYRAEDAQRRGLEPAAGPLTAKLADPGPEDDAFDPSSGDVAAVLAHLAEADEAEVVRVLDAEAAGKARKSLVEQREQLLAAARERAAAGPGGDGGGGGASS